MDPEVSWEINGREIPTNQNTFIVSQENNFSSVLMDVTQTTNWVNLLSTFIMFTIIILAFGGNLLVIVAIATNLRLRRITNMFIISLAVADMALSIFVLPLAILVEMRNRTSSQKTGEEDGWVFPWALCDLWTSSDVFLCTASILNLCAISLDRYLAITRPLKSLTIRSFKFAALLIGSAWLGSILITCPPLLGWRDKGRQSWTQPNNPPYVTQCTLNENFGYILFSSAGSFYFPMILMLALYWKIFSVATKRNQFFANISTSCHKSTSNLSYRRRSFNPTANSCKGGSSDEKVSQTKSEQLAPGYSRSSIKSCPNSQLSLGSASSAEVPSLSSQTTPMTPTTPTFTIELDPISSCAGEDVSIPRYLKYPNSFRRKPHIRSNLASNDNAGSKIEKTFQTQPNRKWFRLKRYFSTDEKTLGMSLDRGRTLRSSRGEKLHKEKVAYFKEQKTAYTLGIVVGTFTICWLPFFLVYVTEPLFYKGTIPSEHLL